MKRPHGFSLNHDGNGVMDDEEANTICMLDRQYLTGMSLGWIADFLYEAGILSLREKERWTQQIISSYGAKERRALTRRFFSGSGRVLLR